MGRRVFTGTAGSGGGVGSLNVISNRITSVTTNEDIILDPDGTGTVKVIAGYTSRSGIDDLSLMPKGYMDKNIPPGVLFINFS
jgi:hypothetical protein